eukprot:3919689-Rhodomonas_salina.1
MMLWKRRELRRCRFCGAYRRISRFCTEAELLRKQTTRPVRFPPVGCNTCALIEYGSLLCNTQSCGATSLIARVKAGEPFQAWVGRAPDV